jgi:hypothetical protein
MPSGSPGIVDPDEAERMGADVWRVKHVTPERRSMPLTLPPEPPSMEAPAKAPRVISSTADTTPSDEYDLETGVVWDEPHVWKCHLVLSS